MTGAYPRSFRARASLGLALALLAFGPAPASGQAPPDDAEAASAALAVTAETEALRTGLDRLVRGSSWGDAEWGVLVVSLDHGDTLYAVNPGTSLAPASNAKLLTTAAALRDLGPDYRFRTFVMTEGDVENGVVHGDLVLYGTGDPGISSRFYQSRDEVFHRLVDQLEEAGIREVRGDLVADASFFPGPLRPEGWDPRDLNDHFTAPVSALSFNENVVSLRIAPADHVGAAPRVHTIPDHAALDVVNLAETVSGRTRPRLAVVRDDPLDPIRIEGSIGTGSSDVWRQLTVSDPAEFTASVFRAALEERGIFVRGSTRAVYLPHQSSVGRLSAPFAGRSGPRILARHSSEPLQSYLEVVNKQSHNLFAELVFRAVGRAATGVGSTEASAEAVRRSLADLGVDTAGVILLDGSGLSAGNRVTPGTLVGLLERMAADPSWESYWATLPEAGRPRELGRMYRTAAARNLRAKTGTIEKVSALSGIVRAADGERLAFSIMLNRTPSMARAKAVENQIGARLASFERGFGTPPDLGTRTAATDVASDLAGSARHRISPGENLSGIAQRYGVSLDELLGANPRVDANRIFAGQWLQIPENGAGG